MTTAWAATRRAARPRVGGRPMSQWACLASGVALGLLGAYVLLRVRAVRRLEAGQDEGEWLAGLAECRSCLYRFVSVCPAETEGNGLECPRCRRCSGELIDEEFGR